MHRPIDDGNTPDPWVLPHLDAFLLTFTLGDRVEVWRSVHHDDFRDAQRAVVFRPDPGAPWSLDLWAPEIHSIDGVFYIYFAALSPGDQSTTRRTVLLRCDGPDPLDVAAWRFLGPVAGLPEHWNIDATVFRLDSDRGAKEGEMQTGREKREQKEEKLSSKGDLFMVYSGWPLGDFSDRQQDLFIVQMKSAEEADADTLTCISRASLPWERTDGGTRGVNEGPTYVSLADGSWRGIVYSANGSWGPDYQLGLLELVDPTQPTDARSWRKRPFPLVVGDPLRAEGPFGPGHASFLPARALQIAPHVLCIHHATDGPGDGWNNRKGYVLSVPFDAFAWDGNTVCCACGQTLDGPKHGPCRSLPSSSTVNEKQNVDEKQGVKLESKPRSKSEYLAIGETVGLLKSAQRALMSCVGRNH